MSKVKPLLPGPVAAARRVLQACDVRHPRDICVEAMAARFGAMVALGPELGVLSWVVAVG